MKYEGQTNLRDINQVAILEINIAGGQMQGLYDEINELVDFLQTNDYRMTTAQINKAAGKFRKLMKKKIQLRENLSNMELSNAEDIIGAAYHNRADFLNGIDIQIADIVEGEK